MFSVVALARPWNQRTNIYNTLAASAFLLLLYEPYFIMSVGFQLSFLAVLGIVYLQPGLYNLWEPKRRIWDEVWKITCVSVAAQVATFSLGLLYFHQFPNYFFISNLFVIPVSFGVLVVGLVVLSVGFISPLAGFFGVILEGSLVITLLCLRLRYSIQLVEILNQYLSGGYYELIISFVCFGVRILYLS